MWKGFGVEEEIGGGCDWGGNVGDISVVDPIPVTPMLDFSEVATN